MNAKEAIAMLEQLPPETEVVVQVGGKQQEISCPPDNGLTNAIVAGMMAGAIAGS